MIFVPPNAPREGMVLPFSVPESEAPNCIPVATLGEVRQRESAGEGDFWELLERQLGAPPTTVLRRLALTLDMPCLIMSELQALTPDFEYLPFHEASQHKCLIARRSDTWLGIITNPFDLSLQGRLEAKRTLSHNNGIAWHLAHPADLVAVLAQLESHLRAMDGVFGEAGQEENSETRLEDLSFSSIARDSSPVIRLVNSTLFDAMAATASDIHLETVAGGLQIKYRIDGVLCSVGQVAGIETAEQIVSRTKVMADLDIAERRIPQDGRFNLSIKGQEVSFRVSVMPSLFGEDVVIRILDKRALTDQVAGLRLELLGFDKETLPSIRKLAREPYGMFLVTGPTGSGKTTTLYAALTEINDGRDKIVTIEDPIEYQLPGILQIPVNEKKGLTFARGLRSILRHDPDKILVGEIRDPETAQIAIQSALTGHLVFTSVHANNVFDVLGRFLHMGVDTYSFVSALNGILAQRLLRVVCPACATSYTPTLEEIKQAGMTDAQSATAHFRIGRGCGACRGTGYKGRHAIGEILRLTDELRELIVARAPIRQIKERAQAHGTRFLRESAITMVCAGMTTLEEINRATFADQ